MRIVLFYTIRLCDLLLLVLVLVDFDLYNPPVWYYAVSHEILKFEKNRLRTVGLPHINYSVIVEIIGIEYGICILGWY